MARKRDLRKLRKGTVINVTSKKQEESITKALQTVEANIKDTYNINLDHSTRWYLKDIVESLNKEFSNVEFSCEQDNTYMTPDGGIMSIVDKSGESYPILISEVKNQGTNDLRMEEGKPKQAMGNAIERLGKNVIGFRTALVKESICPFVCFGYGYDFHEGSSIRDRVVTIARFGKLNKTYLHNEGPHDRIDRGAFYFRRERWSPEEMAEIMLDVADRSILYYFSKYGKDRFLGDNQQLSF
jgi:type II restriction enzyme